MTKHTPGPWSFYTNPVSTALEASVSTQWNKEGKSKLIARLPEMGLHYTEIAANARLIAAAPELLSALELLYETCEANGFCDSYKIFMDDARKAIRKAKGEL